MDKTLPGRSTPARNPCTGDRNSTIKLPLGLPVKGTVKMSGRTLEKATAVVEAAEKEPMVEGMDRTGRVSRRIWENFLRLLFWPSGLRGGGAPADQTRRTHPYIGLGEISRFESFFFLLAKVRAASFSVLG